MISPHNAILGFPRWTAEAAFTGGAWQAAWPVGHMGVEPLAKVARSLDADLASTQFVATLPQLRPIALVVLCRHNLSVTARWRVRLWFDVDRTQMVADSGWMLAWPAVYGPDELDWELTNWWEATYAPDEVKAYPWYLPCRFNPYWYAQAVQVEIDDQGNPDGHVDIGLCEIAQAWQVSWNYALGAQFGPESRTQIQTALGGVDYPDPRQAPRIFKGELSYLPHNEALGKGFELLRRHDTHTPFYWWPDPLDSIHVFRTSFLARLAATDLISRAVATEDRVPLSLREVL